MIKVVHKQLTPFLKLQLRLELLFLSKKNCYNISGDKMRIAILPITNAGAELAKKISAQIGGQIFCKGKDFGGLKNFIADIFDKFDALIFICAAGIAVRMIAPHIVSKLSDPAVIVIDERGRNVISLLSGHVGGGNDLTLKIATAINSNPVITTATDIENKFAADSFAAKLGLMPTPKNAIKAINSAILREEEIYLTTGNVRLNLIPQKLTTIDSNPVITSATDIENKFAADSFAAKLGLMPTPKSAIKAINSAILREEEIYLTAGNVRLNLIPQKLIAGIGCKRGTPAEKIFSAVSQACEMINQPVERIKILASVDIKSDEGGLLEFAKNLGVEIKFFGVAELAKKIAEYKLEESKFVKATLGVGNVCEAAALCCVQKARFALTKKIFDGVTVALIWEKI